jgi:hypothetical protein
LPRRNLQNAGHPGRVRTSRLAHKYRPCRPEKHGSSI